MRKVVANISLSLDGVMQAPGRPDEDTRGGFPHGGWAAPYADEVQGREMGKGMASTGAILLGRRTYEDFYAYWPKQEGRITDVLNATPKYVASTTLREPLPWQNSILLPGDAATAVAKLKDEPGGDIVVLGSGNLLRTLIREHLVDQYVLLVHPIVLGTGTRLFDDTMYDELRLTGSVPTTTGVVINTYVPAGATA
ncbi:MAG TPA: dihydrofolate reductase family protein [Kribbellaceae bacterium]|jgi:dihydrofolate reductase